MADLFKELAALAAPAANGVLTRFLCARGFFGAMLHRFLPAETIQASEEWVPFVFLGHDRTVGDLPPYVNDIAA